MKRLLGNPGNFSKSDSKTMRVVKMAKTKIELEEERNEREYYKTHKRYFRLSFGDVIFNILDYLVFGIFTLMCIFPFYYLFINTISDNSLVQKGVITLLPQGIHLQNYIAMLNVSDLGRAFYITIARTVLGTALMVLSTAFVGYLMTKDEMWGDRKSVV